MDKPSKAVTSVSPKQLAASLATAAIALNLVNVSAASAQAQADTPQPRTRTLKVYSDLKAFRPGSCPDSITAITTASPYREGGFSTSGVAQLFKIAGPARFEASDRYSVTWRALLKPQYRSCIGTAGLLDDKDLPDPGLMRMRFENGYAYFILDMTGYSDPNGHTLNILYQNIEEGNPVWRWGGTD